MATTIVYGLGGYDPKKKNDNIIAIETYDDETGELLEVQTL